MLPEQEIFENERKETASKAVTSIRYRNDIEKSMSKTHWYFVDFESQIQVEISTLNRCHNFHVDSPFKIDEISTNIPRGVMTSNRWQIHEDVYIGMVASISQRWSASWWMERKLSNVETIISCLMWKTSQVHQQQHYNKISRTMQIISENS